MIAAIRQLSIVILFGASKMDAMFCTKIMVSFEEVQ